MQTVPDPNTYQQFRIIDEKISQGVKRIVASSGTDPGSKFADVPPICSVCHLTSSLSLTFVQLQPRSALSAHCRRPCVVSTLSETPLGAKEKTLQLTCRISRRCQSTQQGRERPIFAISPARAQRVGRCVIPIHPDNELHFLCSEICRLVPRSSFNFPHRAVDNRGTVKPLLQTTEHSHRRLQDLWRRHGLSSASSTPHQRILLSSRTSCGASPILDGQSRVSLIPAITQLAERIVSREQVAFLPGRAVRRHLNLPSQDEVDLRAACFCHRNIVDIGYVCSVCLSSEFLIIVDLVSGLAISPIQSSFTFRYTVFCAPRPVCTTCRYAGAGAKVSGLRLSDTIPRPRTEQNSQLRP